MPHIAPQGITKVNAERLLKKDLQRNADRRAARKAEKERVEAERAANVARQQQEHDAAKAARQIEDRANAIKAHWVDYQALNPDAPASPEQEIAAFHAYLAEQGLAPDGTPLADPDAKPSKATYTGPMVALKTARLHYVAAKNGILCNGDPLAVHCGQFERDHTVRALIKALKLDYNPYVSLNPGQQSMNLRNKARHALKNGTLTMAEVVAAYEATKA